MKETLRLLKSLCFAVCISATCLFTASAAPSIRSAAPEGTEEEVVLFEDFSGCTAALADSVPLRNTSTALLDPEMLGEEGWWGSLVYSSNGAVALAYPNYGGCINTPSMNLYGRVTVSFRYRVLEGNKGMRNFWMHVLRGNPAVHAFAVSIEKSSKSVNYGASESAKGWQEFSFTFDNPYNGDDTFVEINAQFAPVAGIEIDDLKITRSKNFVTAPTGLHVKDFNDTDFTVAWNPGAENKSYKVNCIEQKKISDELQSYTEVFASESLPEGWTGDGTITKGQGFDGKDAVALTLNQSLYGPVNYSTVKSLKFSVKPDGLTDMYGMSVVKILGLSESGVWEAPSEIMLLLVPAEGMVIDVAEQAPKFLDKYVGFGLQFYNYMNSEDGKVLVSDFNWTTDGSQSRKDLLKDAAVSTPEITVENIDPDAQHFVQVAGVNGELITEFTPMTEVIGIAAPAEVEAVNPSKDDLSYTAKWNEVPKADAGYLVRNYIVTKAAEEEKGHMVMEENFTTDLPGVAYVKDRTLDAYTDIPGWTVENKPGNEGYAKIGGGILGGDGRAIIISPELPLTNNDGTFTLEFTLSGHGNVMLDVIAGEETQTILLPGEYDWEKNEEAYAEKKFSLTFHSGTPAIRLRFTSPNWHAFMLSKMTVKQDVAKDEYIYRLDRKFEAKAGETSMDIDNKEIGPNLYAFGVQSFMSNGEAAPYESKVVLSPVVDFSISSTAEIEAKAVSVEALNGEICVTLGQDTDMEIYSVSGTQVCSIRGTAGRNVITDLASGIYMVRCLGKTFKVIL